MSIRNILIYPQHKNNMDKKEKVILAIILLITFFINGIVYQQGGFPLHADEYVHLAQARDIIESGSIRFVNPYFENMPFLLKLESGFHIFLAIFIAIFKNNIILIFNILKNLVFVLNTFLIFLFSYYLSKNYKVGIFSAIFFMLLKSSPDILGNLFLLPINLGLTLFLTTMIFFIKYKENPSAKIMSLFILFFVLLIITYPPTAVLAFIILFINQLFRIKSKKDLRNPLTITIISFAIIGLIISIAVKSILKLSLSDFVNKFFIFYENWTPVAFTSPPFVFFGIVASILALIGLTPIIFRKSENNRIILIWFSIILINLYLFYILKMSFFIPSTRLIFFFMINLCILAGYGLNYFIKLAKFIKNKKIRLALITIFIITIFTLQVISLYQHKENVKGILNKDKYDVIKFIGENYGEKNVVMADALTSFAIYPLTGDYVVGLLESNVGSGNRQDQQEFFDSECGRKQEILERNNVTLVISTEKIKCNFLTQIHQEGNVVLYQKA